MLFTPAVFVLSLSCNVEKRVERKGKILFINGFEEVVQDKQQAFLSDENIQILFDLYTKNENVSRKSYVASLEEVKNNNYSLNIPLYVQKYDLGEVKEPINELIQKWNESSQNMKKATEEIFSILNEVGFDEY